MSRRPRAVTTCTLTPRECPDTRAHWYAPDAPRKDVYVWRRTYPIPPGYSQGVITSPPYWTRIDCEVPTVPELGRAGHQRLRRPPRFAEVRDRA
jgi:hypothetical protein